MLDQRQGTPCVPLVFRHKCALGISCGGIGDRIKGLQVTFWLVRADLRPALRLRQSIETCLSGVMDVCAGSG